MARISFQHQPVSERPRRIRRWVLVVSAFLLVFGGSVIGAAHLLTVSDALSVSIVVSGTRLATPVGITKELIGQRMAESWFARLVGPSNALFWSGASRESDVSAVAPMVANVATAVEWGSREVLISVTERAIGGVWCAPAPLSSETGTGVPPGVAAPDEECYLFDENGVLFSRAPNVSGVLILAIHDTNAMPRTLGQRVLPDASWYRNLRATASTLSEEIGPLVSISIRELALREWEARAASGTRFYFSLAFVPENIPGVIRSLTQRKPIGEFSYIDFRVPNRVYYQQQR